MVDKGNVDKHRGTYSSGIKAVEEQKWGRAKAVERYGKLDQPNMKPGDRHAPQRLGDQNNLQGPNYQNRSPDNWVRGFDKSGVESAEGKPNFDKSKR